MKNINNTEEQLYNQFMAELEDGANEYDRMMAEGKAPALTASKSKATIVSIVRWAVIAACFVGLIIGSAFYFINDNTDAHQLAIADNSKPKVNESDTTKENVIAANNIAMPHAETKDVKRINIKKDIGLKNEGDYESFLPDIVLNAPNTDVENDIPAQYPNIRKEYDFDVICYDVLPEINNSDNKTLASADLEMKQVCDKIYYNDIKPLKHSQQ